MVLRTHLPDEIRPDTHHRGDGQQRPQGQPLHPARADRGHEPPDQRIHQAEHQQALHEPHMPRLELPGKQRQQPAHQQQRDAQTHELLAHEDPAAVLVVAARHEIAGNQEIKPHEKAGVGRKEMPDPGQEFRGIAGRVGPAAPVAVRLPRVVEDHQRGQAHLQIIEVIQATGRVRNVFHTIKLIQIQY